MGGPDDVARPVLGEAAAGLGSEAGAAAGLGSEAGAAAGLGSEAGAVADLAREAATPVLHVRGRVILDDTTEVGELWCVGGRVTFDRPRHSGEVTTIEGWAVPGLVDVHCHVGLGPQGEVDAATAERQARTDRDAGTLLIRDAGVQLLVGTDAGGTIGHGRLPHEAAELVRAGIPAAEVLAMASWRTRAFLGVPGLAEGASADLVVYGADPRSDIGVLVAPRAVVLRGSLASRGS